MKDQTSGGDEQQLSKPRIITLAHLAELCDDPARDQADGLEVRALLGFDPEFGFALLAQDGETLYQVVDAEGEPVRYRTIEQALTRLNDVHGLSVDIGVFIEGRGGRH